MKFKKLLTSIVLLTFIFQSTYVKAEDKFTDNNAISTFIQKNPNAKILIAEYNTGKIISEKNKDVQISYKNLINNIAIFVLSEHLRDEKINLETMMEISNDEVLEKYKIENYISVSDAIFLLAQEESTTLALSILKNFNINISQAQLILDKLTLRDTTLVTLEISSDNKTTAKNLAYLTDVTLKNYHKITDITKNPEYELTNGEKIENDIKFIDSDIIRALGISFDGSYAVFVAYSGNTRIVVTIFDISEEKDDFFNSIQEIYSYIFSNYNYKLALKAGTYDINNENVTIETDIYDFFYKEHSEKDIRYFLMNSKILLFQNYDYLSANNGTVFSNYKSNTDNSNLTKLKNTFIQDNKFHERTNKEKIDILLDRSQYFLTFVLLIYSAIFILIYILQKPFTKKEN